LVINIGLENVESEHSQKVKDSSSKYEHSQIVQDFKSPTTLGNSMIQVVRMGSSSGDSVISYQCKLSRATNYGA
jgi:hypothetical protein